LTISGEYIQANDVYCATVAGAVMGWYAPDQAQGKVSTRFVFTQGIVMI
jgi:hypothetical protein